MIRSVLLGTTMLVGLAAAAQAETVTFSSNGGFSNLNNYNCPSGFFTCLLNPPPPASISSNGNTLNMGGYNNSTLAANDFGSSFATDATNVALASLTWTNRASTDTDPSFNVNYNLTLTFTAPNPGDTSSQSFALTIQQPTNPPGDVVSGIAIGNLQNGISLPGIAVSNLHWVVSGGGSYNAATGVWNNPEFTISTLTLVGDFRSTAVPEPMSLALMGAGLLGLGVMRRARRSSAAAA